MYQTNFLRYYKCETNKFAKDILQINRFEYAINTIIKSHNSLMPVTYQKDHFSNKTELTRLVLSK